VADTKNKKAKKEFKFVIIRERKRRPFKKLRAMMADKGCKRMSLTGRELRSMVSDGVLRLTLEEVVIGDLAPDEIVVKVEAAPINPSDLGLLLGPADIASMRSQGSSDRPA
jgi:hypothetical protein